MPKVFNWFTCGSPYEEVAHTNAITFAKAGSAQNCLGISGGTDWVANCNLKPKVALKILGEVAPGEGILLLDADATIEQPIPWIELVGRNNEGPCFAYVLHHKPSGAREVLSGTLWITRTTECRLLLESWLGECDSNPKSWDQRSLAKVIGSTPPSKGGRTIAELDWKWAWIEGVSDRPRSGAYIVHHQMSRQVRGIEALRDMKERERENFSKPAEQASPPKGSCKVAGAGKGKGKPAVQPADDCPGTESAPGIRS